MVKKNNFRKNRTKKLKSSFDWKYWLTIFIAIAGIILSFFAGRASIENSIFNSPNSKIVESDESTTVNVDGSVTTSQLTISSGGRLNIGGGPNYFKPSFLGVYHENLIMYRNVLINSTWGLSFIEFFPPKTWINFGLCNEDQSDCFLYPAFKYNSSIKPCNFIDYTNNQTFIIEPVAC